MYIIVGLGNPENEYSKTRHNMGFNVVNKLAEKHNISISQKKFKGLYGTGFIETKKVAILKPQTFMNLSGESVIEIMNFFKEDLEKLLIIYDDVDIEKGEIKIRKSGSAGTHNGMRSIVSVLGSDKFPRLRVGIGKPEENRDMIAHVIGNMSKEDEEILDKATSKAAEAVEELLKNGIDSAMNKFN